MKKLMWVVLFALAGCTSTQMPSDMQDTIKDATFQRGMAAVRIAVVAPGSGATDDKLKILRAHLPKNVLLAKSYPKVIFHSNTDDQRAAELIAALHNEHVDVIWALRGGYGAARLWPDLQNLQKPDKQKLFIGYSDNTFIHLFLNKWGWQSVHGPALTEFFTPKEGENFKRMSQLLAGKTPILQYPGIKPLNRAAQKSREIQGQIIGGNLTILTNSIGTDWQLNAQHRILFLEDVHSKGHAIDRDLTHLKQAGILNNVSAILLGEFLYGDTAVNYALQRFAAGTDIPVFQTAVFGHGAKNYPLPFGCKSQIAKIEGRNSYRLTVASPRL